MVGVVWPSGFCVVRPKVDFGENNGSLSEAQHGSEDKS
jgi:hypothetical protein